MDDQRKRLYYQSHHRGMKENDLIMGRFAEANLERMSDEELIEFGQLLDQGDNDLFGWIMEHSEPPQDLHGPVLKMIINFRKSL